MTTTHDDSASAAAAINIQRTWRGHQDRRVAKEKVKEREQKREEYFDRANMLEAVLLLQTRARILLARARRRMLLKEKGEDDSQMKATPSLEERRLAASKAANDIQRIWRGHEARKISAEKSQERKRKMDEHLERANLLEAVLLLQTRARMLLARARFHIRARALKAAGLPYEQAAKAEQSASTVQRVWRGHQGRVRANNLKSERDRRRQEHLDKANMLESVLLIQTRARIFIAKARRRIQASVLDHVSPNRQYYEADRAATNVQRVWRGHHDRRTVKNKVEERRRAQQEYIDRANLMEAVLMIQTRVRMFRDRIRLRKLKEEKREKSRSPVQQQEERQQVHSSPTTNEPKPPSTSRPDGDSYRRPLHSSSPTHNKSTNNGSGPSSPASAVHSRGNVYSLFPSRTSPNTSARFSNSSSNNNNSSSNGAASNNNNNKEMYKVPAVSRAGYFVRSYEENVGPNVYQNYLMTSSSSSSQNQQQQNGSSSSNNNNGSATHQNNNNNKKQQRIAVNDKPKYQDVLNSAEGVQNYVNRVFGDDTRDDQQQQHQFEASNNSTNTNNDINISIKTILKQQALYALFDCCGSDKLPVIVDVWESVTPFGSSETLTKQQFFLILEQLRALKVVSEARRSLEKAEGGEK